MKGGPIDIFGMNIKNFILYSKWYKYSEAAQKKIIAERDRLGMVCGNNKRGNNIPMDTTSNAAAIKKSKADISLLERKITSDIEEANNVNPYLLISNGQDIHGNIINIRSCRILLPH